MRRSGSWQTVWDDRILEWIEENDGTGTATQIHNSERLRVSRAHISRRLNILADHGLVQPLGNGVFQITEEGEGYLDEEYNAETGMWLDESEQDEPTAGEAANGV